MSFHSFWMCWHNRAFLNVSVNCCYFLPFLWIIQKFMHMYDHKLLVSSFWHALFAQVFLAYTSLFTISFQFNSLYTQSEIWDYEIYFWFFAIPTQNPTPFLDYIPYTLQKHCPNVWLCFSISSLAQPCKNNRFLISMTSCTHIHKITNQILAFYFLNTYKNIYKSWMTEELIHFS